MRIKMKRIVLIFLVLIVGLCGCRKFEKEVLISKATIQDMVAKKFPYKKDVIIAKINLNSPQVYFREKSIGLKLEYYGNFLEKGIKGHIDFNGQIFYKPEKGAFFIKDFKIVDLFVNKADFSGREIFKAVVLKIVSIYLEDYPVYKLNPSDFKQSITKLLVKSVSVKNESLSVLLSI